jgi:hypothetical protein
VSRDNFVNGHISIDGRLAVIGRQTLRGVFEARRVLSWVRVDRQIAIDLYEHAERFFSMSGSLPFLSPRFDLIPDP